MNNFNGTRKERGIILLLLLGFMAMFAVMVLTFIMVTTNMSETADYPEANTPGITASGETGSAIRNLLAGTENKSNPVGPFGVLENLYGNYENDDTLGARKSLEFGNDFNGVEPLFDPDSAVVTMLFPDDVIVNNGASYEQYRKNVEMVNNLRDHIGTALTFAELDLAAFSEDDPDRWTAILWNRTLAGKSFTILDQWPDVARQVNVYRLNSSDLMSVTVYDRYKIQILPSSEITHFNNTANEFITRWNANPPQNDQGNSIIANAIFDPTFLATPFHFHVRLTPKPFSGTGAGDFSPLSAKDAQMNPADVDPFNLPFAWWANASAPDSYPFGSNTSPDFRTFWNHLKNRSYKPFALNIHLTAAVWRPYYDTARGWQLDYIPSATSDESDPVRLNPSYTAPDTRTLFLAHFDKPPVGADNDTPETFALMDIATKMIISPPEATKPQDEITDLGNGNPSGKETVGVKIIPSFHRPDLFADFAWKYLNAVGKDRNGDNDANAVDWISANKPIDLLEVVRKMTPRPLPLDHWNFSGSNPGIPALNDDLTETEIEALKTGGRASMNAEARKLTGYIADDGSGNPRQYYGRLQVPAYHDNSETLTLGDTTVQSANLSWDVDNDGDGINDGIWIPSGLPIRTNSNGVPYATMYSFTVVDMDGRVNINTAGNWDQQSTLYYDLSKIRDLAITGEMGNPVSPYYDVEKRTEGWRDDQDQNISDETNITRGSGFGPSSVNLSEALAALDLPTGYNPDAIAEKMIWNRYRRSDDLDYRSNSTPPDTSLGTANRSNLLQPSAYSDVANQVVDVSDGHLDFFRFTDAIYDGSLTTSPPDPLKFIFPWRGKTRVTDYGLQPRYFPTFDFNDSGLRAYDPLGNDFYSYPPKYNENPYLANPMNASAFDTPYQASLMERLLRPKDVDVDLLPNLLSGDIAGNNDLSKKINDARLNLTTISNDIPLPSPVFPLGPEEDGDGVKSIRDLIRRCVQLEFYKKMKAKDAAETSTPTLADLNDALDDSNVNTVYYYRLVGNTTSANTSMKMADAVTKMTQEDSLGTLYRQARRDVLLADTYTRRNDKNGAAETVPGFLEDNFGAKIDALTDEIYGMLPDDIKAGRRLNLNDLSHKANWLDLTIDANGTPVAGNGDSHVIGLVERMKFARSLYVLLSVLTYMDRNAQTVGELYFNDAAPLSAVSDYVEGFDEDFFADKTNPSDEDKNLAEELLANRLAQWVVNFVDFTDPDATMTPFYYDPNPFDGWWYFDNSWMTDKSVNGLPLFGLSDENPNFADGDFVDKNVFMPVFATPDFKTSDGSALPAFVNRVNGSLIDGSVSYAKNIANWLEGKNGTGTSGLDFGFRRVWGMERPDLTITETLNFHDLGIADTESGSAFGPGFSKSTTASDNPDLHFDQVTRPQGSTYLEFYSTANPNVPQSPELYRFNSTANRWELELSKMTPRISVTDAPYYGKEFPVWRVAVSATTGPRAEGNSGESDYDTAHSNRKYKKRGNSVLERLIGQNASKPQAFSLQTPQFCRRGDYSSDTNYKPWADMDVCVSNLVGPTQSLDSGNPNAENDIEIDRILWFGQPTASGGGRDVNKKDSNNFDLFPDGRRLYWPYFKGTNKTVAIGPNQYLVVGPNEERHVGSYSRNSSNAKGTDDNYQYFGVGSKNQIRLPDLNTVNGMTMEARTYYGLDASEDGASARGINISEPLWESGTDPYLSIATKSVKINGVENVVVTDPTQTNDLDVPFDLPQAWGGRTPSAANPVSPIADDELFGLGTVPGIRSAFLQRVADPNRPYHPLLNPYLTVDWNMMDLTVFNGEEIDPGDNDRPFFTDSALTTNKTDGNNNLIFTNVTPEPLFGTGSIPLSSRFSSRQWMNASQLGFFPSAVQSPLRPNPWGRPISQSDLTSNAGLEEPLEKDELRNYNNVSKKWDLLTTAQKEGLVVEYGPTHTLGWFNNRGSHSPNADDNWFSNLETAWHTPYIASGTDSAYLGSPNGPFEHLVWNDSPLANPGELLTVPASAPGRFGLEFIRNANGGVASSANLDVATFSAGNKRSLGSGNATAPSPFGFEFVKKGGTSGDHYLGPYLNFFNSGSTGFNFDDGDSQWKSNLGKSLNLATLLDFVHIPSNYYGSAVNVGNDKEKNPIFRSILREPGKINVNTLRQPAWAGLLGESATGFHSFQAARQLDGSFLPIQAATTLALDRKGSLLAPSDATLLSLNLGDAAKPLLNSVARGNLYAATDEIQKLSSLTTTRSNVFAVWLTVGYFEVERARPGENIPNKDPDDVNLPVNSDGYLDFSATGITGEQKKFENYYQAIYPDGYTYGKELGLDDPEIGGVTRHRAFYLIDRSIPVDFRRGQSWNWRDTILLERNL